MLTTNKDKIPVLIGEKVRLTPLLPTHLIDIKQWGVHTNKLFLDYNISELSPKQLSIWYSYRKKTMRTNYFAVFNEEDIMVGYIGLKDINILKRSAFLGIAFDPNYLENGYGTDSLKVLLSHFFNDLKMKTMFLEVNAFNDRAIALYKRAGFKNEGEFLVEFEVGPEELEGLDIIKDTEYFVFSNGKLLSRILRMRLDKLNY